MMNIFEIKQPTAAINATDQRFPVGRIFCIGKNYAAHAREMGADPAREPPFYFAKTASSIVASGSTVAYPPRTSNLHHEIEWVVAIGRAGANISVADAPDHIFGYAVGIDLTRRDLQAQSCKAGRPWETAKSFDQSAAISDIVSVAESGHPQRGRIWLAVNDEIRQDGDLAEMIWSVSESIAEISTYRGLAAGDLIYTGTPAGVGPLVPGDKVTGGIDGIGEILIEIGRDKH